MWAIKEAHRRAEALGRCFSISLQQRQKRSRQMDIRPYLRRLRARTGTLTISDSSFEDTPLETLFAEPSTLPPPTGRLRRTGTLTSTKLQLQRPTGKHHNFFSLTRRRQDQLRQPRLRTLHSGSWDTVAGLDWLLDPPRGPSPDSPPAPDDNNTDLPHNTHLNTNKNDSSSSSFMSDNNNNTDNLNNNDCSDSSSSSLLGLEASPRWDRLT